LSYEKRTVFLSELNKNADNFKKFFTGKTSIFSKIYSLYLAGFSEEEVNILYSKLPFESFILDKSDFEKRIDELVKQMKSEQAKYKLQSLWYEKTLSKTPKDWAVKYKTSPLSLVPPDLQGDCRRAFEALNRNNPEETEVIFALDFLQSKATFLSDLSDIVKINNAFSHDIIGRFIVLLPNIDEVRSYLDSNVTITPYDWYGDPTVQQAIEKLAQSKYNLEGCDKVLTRIEKMEAEETKKYLKQLIKDNMNVGIEIISNEGSL
jgi:hypothetical protein